MLRTMLSSETAPTPLPPPPRSVRGGAGCGLWLVRVFILPHVCVGVGVAGLTVLTALVAALGTDLAATVTGAHTSRGHKGGISYQIDYRYRIGARDYTHSGGVSAETYAAVGHPRDLEGPPATVRVRHLTIGPWNYGVLTQERTAWKAAGGLLVFAVFWCAILSIFVYLIWVIPIRNRLLVRNGQTTTGTIVKSRVNRGKSTSYYATFRFQDPATGREIEREMTLPGKEQYEAAWAGKAVTVVYSPRHPKRALAYELSGYRVSECPPPAVAGRQRN